MRMLAKTIGSKFDACLSALTNAPIEVGASLLARSHNPWTSDLLRSQLVKNSQGRRYDTNCELRLPDHTQAFYTTIVSAVVRD